MTARNSLLIGAVALALQMGQACAEDRAGPLSAPGLIAQADCKPGALPAFDLPEKDRAAARHVYYVSPQGDDRWSGTLARPDAQRANGPFATLEAARDAARDAGGPASIVVAGGDYYLASPVVFGPQDAGLAVLAGCGESPVLHGGPAVTGWTAGKDGRWVAPLRLPPGQAVGDLFVDGIVQDEARYPNAPADHDPRKGWLFADKPDVDAWQGNIRFRFRPGDLPEMKGTGGLVAHIVGGFLPGSQWGSDTLPVMSIDAASRTIHTGGTAYFFTAEGSRYFLSGSPDLLDAPREWWYDAEAGQLSYIPADPSFKSARIVAGVLPTFLRLENAGGMTISGLTFRDGAPQGSGKYGTDMRAFGAIRLEQSDGVRLIGNVIDNVGVGIHVSQSRDVLIAHNEISHVAGDGIYIGTVYGKFGKSSGAQVLANHIHDIGRVYFESSGIWFHAAENVRIADNLVEDTAQLGIAGGSIWEGKDAIHNAVIEHNEVRNANRLTADGGAIKLMGTQADLQNSSIRANVVSGTRQLMNKADGTFWPADYENTDEWPSPISWAIYTDLKASGVRIEGNVLCGNVAAIGINGGWNNVVTGNFIAQGTGTAFRLDDGTGRDWHPDWAKPNLIEDNMVSVGAGGGTAVAIYAPGHGSGYAEFRNNRYSGGLDGKGFKMQPEIMPSGKYGSLADFQKVGGERGSILLPAEAADEAAGRCR